MDLLVRMGVLWRADWISEYASETSPGERSGPWQEELAGGGIVEGGDVRAVEGKSRDGMGGSARLAASAGQRIRSVIGSIS